MENRRFPVFSSPVASQKRWTTNRNKRKCSFGSTEKPSRKQFYQNGSNDDQDRFFSKRTGFNDSCGLEDEFSSPTSWADEVEHQDKIIYTEKARSKYADTKRARNQSIPDQQQGEVKPIHIVKKSMPYSLRNPLQPTMTDEHRLNQRQKQIDMGKNTLGYDMFSKNVLRLERTPEDPRTPDKYQQCSTRSWQGQIKVWRRKLHMWDPEQQTGVLADPFSSSTSFNNESYANIGTSSGSSSQTSDFPSRSDDSFGNDELFQYFDGSNENEDFGIFAL